MSIPREPIANINEGEPSNDITFDLFDDVKEVTDNDSFVE
jgi:hypothetical protein